MNLDIYKKKVKAAAKGHSLLDKKRMALKKKFTEVMKALILVFYIKL
jgi:vacuolar-type H+-ATPase subunit D/Vma8